MKQAIDLEVGDQVGRREGKDYTIKRLEVSGTSTLMAVHIGPYDPWYVRKDAVLDARVGANEMITWIIPKGR